MDNAFDSLKERVELGVKNKIPVESRLIMLGEIIYALGRQDIIPKQARELEELLGLASVVKDYAAIREQGFFGELIDNIQA